jgi:hypothetical protein
MSGNASDGNEQSGGFRIEIEAAGFPDSIANDFDRGDGRHVDGCMVEYDAERHRVVLAANHSNAAKWLYDWLEETRQYYKENYVDASGEHDAARDMANAVYEEMKS